MGGHTAGPTPIVSTAGGVPKSPGKKIRAHAALTTAGTSARHVPGMVRPTTAHIKNIGVTISGVVSLVRAALPSTFDSAKTTAVMASRKVSDKYAKVQTLLLQPHLWT